MSFQDVCHDLEAGLPPRPPPPPHAVVAHCVFQINTKVSELRRLAHEIAAGAGDARVVRERIRRARADVTRLARNTARRLADPAAAAAVGPNLATDFQAALREFQWVQGQIIEADRQETAAAAAARRVPPMFPPPSPPSYGSSPIGSSQLNNANATAGAADQQYNNIQMQQQQQLVESWRTQELALLDNEITFNEALVEEREREICKIQQEIAEINEISVDLAKLVRDQQGAIDVVETNVEKAAMETSKAEEQLSRAALTHETSSSMKCLLITVFGLVMFIFALVSVA
ncbi:syntaxin-22-like [Miscanthus floridulus]|uniref:syntaxin-22-like n=1 Tax=Miscanthus floridulus TaxID=154761 RepID=UPI00345A2C44